MRLAWRPPAGRRREGNLPAELTSFVGRSRLLTTIKQRIQQSRLVTVTGIGGVGKTADRSAGRPSAAPPVRRRHLVRRPGPAAGRVDAPPHRPHRPRPRPTSRAARRRLPGRLDGRAQGAAHPRHVRAHGLGLRRADRGPAGAATPTCGCWPPAAARSTPPASRWCRSRRCRCRARSRASRPTTTTPWSCSGSGPPPWCPTSRSRRTTSPPSPSCACGSTASRWRSSWRRSGCAPCRWSRSSAC